MVRSCLITALACLSCGWLCGFVTAREPDEVLTLWSGTPPNESGEFGEEVDTTRDSDRKIAGRRLQRIGNVTTPTLAVFHASREIANGAGVVVCPGGGFHILAWDLEGTEVADWLNSIGVTAFVLKYRVPRRPDQEAWLAPLTDGQRALRMVRHEAEKWDIDPRRLGMLGFSAGAHLAAAAAAAEPVYEEQDDKDRTFHRPDFSVLIYPGGLIDAETGKLRDHFAFDSLTPPFFVAQAQDDPVVVENSLRVFEALHRKNVPADLHVYSDGGHGFGLRETGSHSALWPDCCHEWMDQERILTPGNAFMSYGFGRRMDRAKRAGVGLPQLSRAFGAVSLADAYCVQKEFVARRLMDGKEAIAGFKGAAVGAGAQEKMGLDHALSAVLWESGRHEAKDEPTLPLLEGT
ncbi:MAG: alpha/beta hydrolase fold domain-containing protein, partial [Verrucomicrobiota bacterium]